MSVKILLVDDNRTMRTGMRSSIEQRTDWVVCGEAENGEIAVEMVQTLLPSLVILDLSMPGIDGLETARRISAISPGMPMIMFTLHASALLWEQAQQLGIQHVFSKEDGFGDSVFEAMRAILSHGKAA
ncbi:MAG: response regulator transcription factor [Terriglobales bacterium]